MSEINWSDRLEVSLQKLEIKASDRQFEQVQLYYDHLVKTNKVMNLTAITDEEGFAVKHILDSLLICKYVDFEKIHNLIDVGTGAGFPGIPLKIFFPDLQVTLADSLKKRVGFLKEVIDILDIHDIDAIHGRAEDLGKQKKYRESFDLCVSRAVSQLNILAEYCMPFVKEKGLFVAYKSVNSDEEVSEAKKAIEVLGGSDAICYDTDLFDIEVPRRFVYIRKERKTLAKYPRKAGTPQKNPL